MVDMSTKATKVAGHGERINKMGWEHFVLIFLGSMIAVVVGNPF